MLDDRSLLFSDNMGNGMRGLFEVNYEGALSKARDFRPEVNYCCEYKNVFIFTRTDDNEFTGPQPVVVIRETGEAMLMPKFVATHGKEGDLVREFIIEGKYHDDSIE